MAGGLRKVAALADPVGEVTEGWVRPNGLRVDAGAGSARRRRRDLREPPQRDQRRRRAVPEGRQRGLPARLVVGPRVQPGRGRRSCAVPRSRPACPRTPSPWWRTPRTRRPSTSCGCAGSIDCLIPRGGPSLIASLIEHATVPYVLDGDGNCHIYIDGAADLAMAHELVGQRQDPPLRSVQRGRDDPGAPGRRRRASAAAGRLARGRRRRDPGRRACPRHRPSDAVPALEEDFATEFLGPVVAIGMVDDVGDAIEHIARYSSGHSEAIVTSDVATADRFVAEVDGAAVLVNASTRFVDGEELGLGAEVGISTQKLHARGPMGVKELTTLKWVVRGDGQVRSVSGGERAGAARGGAAALRVPRRGAQRPGPRRLPGRRLHQRRGLPGRPPGQAGARRGPGGDGQDPAGQVGGRADRRAADPPAVLRGARRVQGALRVELPQAAAAHPGRRARPGRDRGPVVAGARGGHLLGGLPAHPARCSRPSGPPSPSCSSSTRSTASSSRPRRCCSRSSPSTRSPSPSSAPCAPRSCRWSSSPPTTPASCPRRSSAAASTSTSTTPTSTANARSCGPRCPASARNWPTRWRASCARCARSSCARRPRSPRRWTGRARSSCSACRRSTPPRRRDTLHVLLKYQADIERASQGAALGLVGLTRPRARPPVRFRHRAAPRRAPGLA